MEWLECSLSAAGEFVDVDGGGVGGPVVVVAGRARSGSMLVPGAERQDAMARRASLACPLLNPCRGGV